MEQKRKRANLCNKHPIKTFSHNATQPKQLKSLRTNNAECLERDGWPGWERDRDRDKAMLSTVAYLTSCKNVSRLEKLGEKPLVFIIRRGVHCTGGDGREGCHPRGGALGVEWWAVSGERWGIKDFRLVDRNMSRFSTVLYFSKYRDSAERDNSLCVIFHSRPQTQSSSSR